VQELKEKEREGAKKHRGGGGGAGSGRIFDLSTKTLVGVDGPGVG